jgi:hypothetical protein
MDHDTAGINGCSISFSHEEINVKGKMVKFSAIEINGLKIVIKGKYIKIAEVREEWDQDVMEPELIIDGLKKSGRRIDLFTFIQRLPESRPKYNYYREWDSVAAIPIVSYEHWLRNQIPDQARNKIRKAAKMGVEIRKMAFEDELIRGISSIYNESRIRQGTKNTQYNMPYEMVRLLNSTFLDRSEFLGAFYNNELIGYLKIAYTDRFARVMGILGKVRHQEKSPMNLLIAKAVEICSEKRVPYFVYAKYDYGKVGSDSLKDFKKGNGFENILIPRYFVAFNKFGSIVMKMGLYRGIKNMLPRRLVVQLLKIRKEWYSLRYSNSLEEEVYEQSELAKR